MEEDWNYIATSQGIPKATKELEEAGRILLQSLCVALMTP